MVIGVGTVVYGGGVTRGQGYRERDRGDSLLSTTDSSSGIYIQGFRMGAGIML